jgi:hypothetical protein
MSTKSDQLKKILEQMVRAEVQRVVPILVKEEMLRVMGGMLMERTLPASEPWQGNSDKRRELMNEAAYAPAADRPPMDRASLAEAMGYGDMLPMDRVATPTARGGITLSSRVDQHGNVIPIDPTMVPDIVQQAINRDYRAVMKVLDEKTKGVV